MAKINPELPFPSHWLISINQRAILHAKHGCNFTNKRLICQSVFCSSDQQILVLSFIGSHTDFTEIHSHNGKTHRHTYTNTHKLLQRSKLSRIRQNNELNTANKCTLIPYSYTHNVNIFNIP